MSETLFSRKLQAKDVSSTVSSMQKSNSSIPDIDELYNNRLKLHACAEFAVACLGLMLSIAAAEGYYNNGYAISESVTWLKLAVTVSTVVSIALCVGRHTIMWAMWKRRSIVSHKTRYYQSALWWQLMAELAILALHCPVGIYGKFTVTNLALRVTYSFDDIGSICMLLRAYQIFTVTAAVKGLQSKAAQSIANLHGISLTAGFSLRALLDERPFTVITMFQVVQTLAMSYALRVFERPVCHSNPAWCDDVATMGLKRYDNFSVCVWNIMITALTVGLVTRISSWVYVLPLT